MYYVAALKKKIENLFHGKGPESVLFARFLLVLNLVAVFLFLLEPLFPEDFKVRSVEVLFGSLFLLEYLARIWISKKRVSFFFNLLSLLDLIVITSLFAPLLLGNFGFLRVIRAFRILRIFRVLKDLKGEKNWFHRHEDILQSMLHLFAFIFITTDLVYVLQVDKNDAISTYVDALYFTLTTLTTTGFGDITLQGSGGKMLAIFIMVFGITLFVKLARDVFRPAKVHHTCQDCGLNLHDSDASHCKHCGHVIRIVTGGE